MSMMVTAMSELLRVTGAPSRTFSLKMAAKLLPGHLKRYELSGRRSQAARMTMLTANMDSEPRAAPSTPIPITEMVTKSTRMLTAAPATTATVTMRGRPSVATKRLRP